MLVAPGLNIQFPISRLILSGEKTIETRTYPLPKNYINRDLILIETPGKNGNFKARGIATIRFSSSFPYKSERAFYKDKKRHHVTPDSPWAWDSKAPKYGWIVANIEPFPDPKEVRGKRGIKFTRRVLLAK